MQTKEGKIQVRREQKKKLLKQKFEIVDKSNKDKEIEKLISKDPVQRTKTVDNLIVHELDEQTEIYNYFEDINNMDNILFMSGAIEKKDGDLIITEKGKEYKFPYTFYSDINTLN